MKVIPKHLDDITPEWVSNVWNSCSSKGACTSFSHLRISPSMSNEGFSDTCRVSSDVFRWIVMIVPDDSEIRDIIRRHRLFDKEISTLKRILPKLKDFVSRNKVEPFFQFPHFVDGDYDTDTGTGYLIVDDFVDEGFRLDDPMLLLLSHSHAMKTIRRLATFHAACVSYRILHSGDSELEEYVPLSEESTWFQQDMSNVLQEMYSTCLAFFRSVPGEEELCRWFETKMANPEAFHRGRTPHIKSLVHGDLWHSNVSFRDKDILINDWQMVHVGQATDDLCFLLFSSTSAKFRREHWDEAMNVYFDSFRSTIQQCGVEDSYNVSFEQFMEDVKASVPLSIFFCGNIHDLQLDDDFQDFPTMPYDDDGEFICMGEAPVDHESSSGPTTPTTSAISSRSEKLSQLPLLERRGLKKIPTIASQREICKMEKLKDEGKSLENIHPQKARAMRRKVYLDLYREALETNYI